MPSRYSLTSTPETVRAWFGYQNTPEFPPRYNIAPTQPVAIVRNDHKENREFALVRWGLIPSWAKQPEKFSVLINARAETVAEKPSFRAALRHRRCLVPADAFYEWAGPKGDKQPYLIRLRSREMLAFAGLWEHWLGADGSEAQSMAIVTRAAVGDMAQFHDRVPLMLPQEHFDTWLDCRSGSAQPIAGLLEAGENVDLEIYAVDRQLNNPRNDFAGVQQPVELPLSLGSLVSVAPCTTTTEPNPTDQRSALQTSLTIECGAVRWR